MKINVKVIPGAKKNSVVQQGDIWKVHVSAPALEGKANEALLKVLADHFKVKKRQVKIVKGEKSRVKAVVIDQAKE